MENGVQLCNTLGRKKAMVRATQESGQRGQETKSHRDIADSFTSKESRESKAMDGVQFWWRQVVRTGLPGLSRVMPENPFEQEREEKKHAGSPGIGTGRNTAPIQVG